MNLPVCMTFFCALRRFGANARRTHSTHGTSSEGAVVGLETLATFGALNGGQAALGSDNGKAPAPLGVVGDECSPAILSDVCSAPVSEEGGDPASQAIVEV